MLVSFFKGMLLKLNCEGAMATADGLMQRCSNVLSCAFSDFKTEESVFVCVWFLLVFVPPPPPVVVSAPTHLLL